MQATPCRACCSSAVTPESLVDDKSSYRSPTVTHGEGVHAETLLAATLVSAARLLMPRREPRRSSSPALVGGRRPHALSPPSPSRHRRGLRCACDFGRRSSSGLFDWLPKWSSRRREIPNVRLHREHSVARGRILSIGSAKLGKRSARRFHPASISTTVLCGSARRLAVQTYRRSAV